MKRKIYTLIVAAMAMAGSVGAGESADVWRAPRNDIEEILMGDAQVLSVDSIVTGTPIHAFKVSRGLEGDPDYIHVGLYVDATIHTRFGLPDGVQQHVYYRSSKTDSSKSTAWRTELLGEVRWLVFYHDGFQVYSTAEEQFVIADQGKQ